MRSLGICNELYHSHESRSPLPQEHFKMSLSPFMCSSRDGQWQTDSSILGFANQTILGTKEGKCYGHKMSYVIPSNKMNLKMGWFSLYWVSPATGCSPAALDELGVWSLWEEPESSARDGNQPGGKRGLRDLCTSGHHISNAVSTSWKLPKRSLLTVALSSRTARHGTFIIEVDPFRCFLCCPQGWTFGASGVVWYCSCVGTTA